MKILLIGAGAVGQVYGHHFQRGGADVSFYVREKYADEVRQGFNLYPMNRRKPRAAPVRFEGFGVFTDLAVAMAEPWDAVVLCISSTALRAGTWLSELAAGLGEATLVTLTPGMGDYDLIAERAPAEQIVCGMIGLSSYPGPLEGEELPTPGMVYWVPPMTKMPFSGPEARTKAIVETLTRGGLKSKVVDDVKIGTAFGGPVLQFQMVALELVGWRFKPLRKDKALMRLTHRATREAFEVASKRLGKKIPLMLRMLRPWIMRTVMRLMGVVSPLDMERFFEKHFTKVGDQTIHGMDTTIDEAESLASPHEAISELRQRLVDQRAAS